MAQAQTSPSAVTPMNDAREARPAAMASRTTPVVDWTDRFLSRRWPFAKDLPLHDIDGARAMARREADQIANGNIFDGRPTMQLSRARLESLLELAATWGARVTVQHYAEIDASRRTLGGRWKRGLFRLWCAASGLWLGFIALLALGDSSAVAHVERVVVIALAVPLVALVVSIITIKLSIWVLNGFRGGP